MDVFAGMMVMLWGADRQDMGQFRQKSTSSSAELFYQFFVFFRMCFARSFDRFLWTRDAALPFTEQRCLIRNPLISFTVCAEDKVWMAVELVNRH